MKNLLFACLGGAFGSGARFLVNAAAVRWVGQTSWGTLLVNVIGSFAISLLSVLVLAGRVDEQTRVLVGIGVLGGFTTYSSFNLELLAMAGKGAWGGAALYLLGTVTTAIGAGLAGAALGRTLTS